MGVRVVFIFVTASCDVVNVVGHWGNILARVCKVMGYDCLAGQERVLVGSD